MKPFPGQKQYIGDRVYVVLDKGTICLSTENGYETTNVIYLEPEVWRALKAWVENVEKSFANETHS